MKTFITCLTVFFILNIVICAQAQKLPNTQEVGLRAPATTKIDGKATEWNNQFQAYNKSTDIFYTISNDDDKLYLTIQSVNPEMITKIIGGGLTFTVQKSGRKNDKNGVSITFPVFNKANRPDFNLQSIKDKKAAGPFNIDSAILVYNNVLSGKALLIATSGIPGLDSVSVYNQDGIKVAQLFDNKLAYTYELAIDLKQLGISVSDAAKFAYHINLGTSVSKNLLSMMNFEVKADGSTANAGVNPAAAYTDFWGEYTLVK